VEIRSETHSDAEEGSLVLRRSIEELCHEDHGGNRATIAEWIGNKTADTWRVWVDQQKSRLLVAIDAGRILGVGMMNTHGEILLNYVSPDARLRGVSKALLGHQEAEALRLGIAECSLESTQTARRFYQACGYVAGDGASAEDAKMIKRLSADTR
jgi:GNAT superfamily N-acetyltransferase